jgi:tetratricopeptide (TPR) repeat protein
MQSIRTQGMGLLAFACLLVFNVYLHAEEGPVERADAILGQVQALAAAGQAEEADKLLALSVEEFRALVQAQPDDALAWIGLGGLQATQRKFDDAETSIRAAIRLEPKNQSARGLLRTVLIDANRHDEAIPLYQQEIQLFPNDVELRRDYVASLVTMRKLDEAEAQLRAALQLDVRDPDSILLMSAFLKLRQKSDEAAATLRGGIVLNPKDVNLRKELVLLLYDAKVYSEAYDELLEIRKLQPEDIDVEEKLILLAAKNRKSDWAEKHIARLRELRIAQKQETEYFWRDEFWIEKQRVVVEEYFEIKGDAGLKYVFTAYGEDGREQCKVIFLLADKMTQDYRKRGQIKDSEQIFVLAKAVGEKPGPSRFFRNLLPYELVRRAAIELMEPEDIPKVLLRLAPKPTAENAPQPAAK